MKNLRLAISITFLIFSVSALHAAPLYWDPGTSSGANLGGSGTWDQVSSYWYNGSADVPWNNAGGSDAIFTGTAGTATLTGNITAADLYFTNLTGNMFITNSTGTQTLTLGTGIVDTGGGDDILGVALAGSQTLTKNGGGTLELNGVNSGFSGPVVVNQGVVEVENSSALGTGSVTVTNAASVTFPLTGTITFPNASFVSGGGATNLGALNNIGTSTTIMSGLLTLESTNVVIGATAGKFEFTGGIGEPAGLNASLTFLGAGSVSIPSGVLNIGTGPLIVNGPDVNNEATSSTLVYSNLVIENGGLYATADSDAGFGKDPASFNATNITLNGGILQISHTFTFNGNRGFYAGPGGGALQENTSSGSPTIETVISGPGAMHIEADGTGAYWKFTANNTYTGGTLVDSGSGLWLGGGGGAGTAGTGNITNNGTLTINRSGTTTFANNISGSGSMVVEGTGYITLAGASSYTGATTDEAEMLLVSNTTGSATGTGLLTVTGGATLGGNGIITGPVSVVSGTLQPGLPYLTSVGVVIISNTLALGSGSTTTLEMDATVPTNSAVLGLSSVTYGGILNVNLINGTPAAGQSYQLFQAASYSGSFDGGINLPGLNSGLAWNTNNLSVNGTISVVALTGVFNPPLLSGTNLVLSGSYGTPYGSYSVLTTTNLTTPVANWTVVSSGNSFDDNGNFSFTNAVNPSQPAQFFMISQP